MLEASTEVDAPSCVVLGASSGINSRSGRPSFRAKCASVFREGAIFPSSTADTIARGEIGRAEGLRSVGCELYVCAEHVLPDQESGNS